MLKPQSVRRILASTDKTIARLQGKIREVRATQLKAIRRLSIPCSQCKQSFPLHRCGSLSRTATTSAPAGARRAITGATLCFSTATSSAPCAARGTASTSGLTWSHYSQSESRTASATRSSSTRKSSWRRSISTPRTERSPAYAGLFLLYRFIAFPMSRSSCRAIFRYSSNGAPNSCLTSWSASG